MISYDQRLKPLVLAAANQQAWINIIYMVRLKPVLLKWV